MSNYSKEVSHSARPSCLVPQCVTKNEVISKSVVTRVERLVLLWAASPPLVCSRLCRHASVSGWGSGECALC